MPKKASPTPIPPPAPTPAQMVVGYDPGFGNTKICVDGQVAVVQSAVARPKSVGLAAIGMKTIRSVPLVSFGGQQLAIGLGAWQKGEPLTSMDYSALTGPERTALFYGAMAQVLPVRNGHLPPSATVVVGLPVTLLQDEIQAQAVLSALKALKGLHEFEVGGQGYCFKIDRLRYIAQPVGCYMDWLYDDQLQPRKGGGQAEVAVVDIGMNTVDLYVVKGARVQERHVNGAEVGVKRLLDMVMVEDGRDLVELDADLRTKQLRVKDSQLESWLGEILAVIKRTWPNLRRFSALVPTGGGALVLGDRLKLALANKGATLHWPADPVQANVRGFWKYGLIKAKEDAQ